MPEGETLTESGVHSELDRGVNPYNQDQYRMDRAFIRLTELINAMRFVNKYASEFDQQTLEKMLDLFTQELANITTPGVAWRQTAKYQNGLDIKPATPVEEK